MELSHVPRGPGTCASSKSKTFLSDFHSQPETSVFHGRLAGAHCTAAPWHCPCSVGKLPSSWHLNKFGSNSSPWLLKTRTKTTVINYSIQGPGGNLKTSSQGQGFSGNRSVLTRGRASLRWWLHLQDNAPHAFPACWSSKQEHMELIGSTQKS